jgi:hypothetical protein
VFAWFLDLVNESKFIVYIIWYQSRKMARRGRGRVRYLAQMYIDMQNIQRQVADFTNVLASQRIIQREVFDDETIRGDVDQHTKHEEEQLERMNFEERMLRALEGRNDGIKMEVLEYAGSLKLEELIDWLKSMEFIFEWKSMTKEKKVKFACTKLKGHAMIW